MRLLNLGHMFHPSPPTFLSFAESFPLRYVTAPSQAPNFTTTTASSADPLPITDTSLLCLGTVNNYNGPVQTVLHWVRSIAMSSPTHLLYPVGLRKGYGTSAVPATSSSLPGLPEVRTKLGRQFWLRLPSDPSLANHLVPLHKTDSRWKFLRAPLPLPTCCLLSGLMTGFSPASYRPCQSHQICVLRISAIFSKKSYGKVC